MVRTSNDAADLSQRKARETLDALLRDDCPVAIHVHDELALRHQLRAMAAMRPPTFIN